MKQQIIEIVASPTVLSDNISTAQFVIPMPYENYTDLIEFNVLEQHIRALQCLNMCQLTLVLVIGESVSWSTLRNARFGSTINYIRHVAQPCAAGRSTNIRGGRILRHQLHIQRICVTCVGQCGRATSIHHCGLDAVDGRAGRRYG
jgi:hypothetical protein